MKAIIIILITSICILINTNLKAQSKLSTETTITYDKLQGGIPTNRLEIQDPLFNIKYDYKVDLINKGCINDVFGINLLKLIDQKTFTLDGGFIKLGDWNKSDQIILHLTATKKIGSLTWSLEGGRAFGVEIMPWDYVTSRISRQNFTVEGYIMSPDQLMSSSHKKLYAWAAYHPEHMFAAIGTELSRDWFFLGTKKMKDFGDFTFANYDRNNGNFWFRTQFGFQDVNQKFFEQNNYIIATSYLVLPVFFYKHFSPMSTKGLFAFKIDGRKVGKSENYEVTLGHQFGKFGQCAIGPMSQNMPTKKIGLLVEYYKEFNLYKKISGSTEFRYEQMSSRLSGYIILNYKL